MAWTIKELSCDGQTKHGCVITTDKNRPLGWGYNSFPRKCDNHTLPNLRPDKYPWMIHSERNAVSNCIEKPHNAIAYVTGLCCFDCVSHLWQNGVTTIYQMNRSSSMLEYSEDERLKEELLSQVGKESLNGTLNKDDYLEINVVDADFTFSLDIQAEAKKLNLIHDERERSGRCFEDVS